MLRLWPRRLRIWVHASVVHVDELGWQNTVLRRNSIPCDDPWALGTSWHAALHGGLKKARRAGLSVQLMLGSHWGRLGLVPWSDQVLSKEEKRRQALAYFLDLHGEAAGGWTVRLGQERFGAPILACAYPSEFLDRVATWAATHGVRISSIRPTVSHAWPVSVKERTDLFVFCDDHYVDIFLRQSGKPVRHRAWHTADVESAIVQTVAAWRNGEEVDRLLTVSCAGDRRLDADMLSKHGVTVNVAQR